MKKIIIIPLSLILIYVIFIKNKFIWDPSININENPYIESIYEESFNLKHGCVATSTNYLEFKSRLLSKKDYRGSRFYDQDIAIYDFVLGWGIMSIDKYIKKVNISQNDRWFFYKMKDISHGAILEHFDNFHMIPENDSISEKLDNVIPGQVIALKGYLVS